MNLQGDQVKPVNPIPLAHDPIAAIEFVRDFSDLGAGHGGYNEDHEFFGYRQPI